MPVGKTLCRIPIELFRVKPVITPEIHKPPVGLQARQAVVGGNPYVSLRVFGYAVDIVVGKTVRRVVVHVCLLAVFHLAPIHSVAVGLTHTVPSWAMATQVSFSLTFTFGASNLLG